MAPVCVWPATFLLALRFFQPSEAKKLLLAARLQAEAKQREVSAAVGELGRLRAHAAELKKEGEGAAQQLECATLQVSPPRGSM